MHKLARNKHSFPRPDPRQPPCAGRWNQERRAAAEELARTHQAIVAVQGKLQTLVGGSRQACIEGRH